MSESDDVTEESTEAKSYSHEQEIFKEVEGKFISHKDSMKKHRKIFTRKSILIRETPHTKTCS